MTERIAAAAIFMGATISLPPPARHHTILATMDLVMGLNAIQNGAPTCQGFITSTGRYVNRVEAYYIANAAGQIIHKSGNKGEPTLYSEDMW
jgi:hypothetical protein